MQPVPRTVRLRAVGNVESTHINRPEREIEFATSMLRGLNGENWLGHIL